MSTDNLTPIERGMLIVLMAEGRPLRDRDLKGVHGIALAPRHRRRLQSLGLINATAKPLGYELSQKGWQWARNELAARRPDDQIGNGALYAVLNALDKYLDRHQVSLARVFGSVHLLTRRQPPLVPENDVEAFYMDRIETATADSSVAADGLYDDYCAWCTQHQKERLSRARFGQEFGGLGLHRIRIAGKSRYTGISLRSDTPDC
jgi:hypothetical protein